VSIQLLKKHIGQAEREIHVLVYGYSVFQNPPYMASRQLLIPRIAAFSTSLSPLPCQAWHGYGVASTHRVEVEVGADGHASAAPSGAAAAAPPAGANFNITYPTIRYFIDIKTFEVARRVKVTTLRPIKFTRP
jgi:hypothetical protein